MPEARIAQISRVTVGLLLFAGVGAAAVTDVSPFLILPWAAAIALGQLIPIPTKSGGILYFGIAAAVAVPLLFDDPVAITSIYSLGLVFSFGL